MEERDGPDRAAIDRPATSESPLDMPTVPVIIHERVANWSRQLRPRFSDGSILWTESRSTGLLILAAARSACPILVVPLDREPVRPLIALDEALQVAPNALSMVLDPLDRAEVAEIAREVGASIVLNGPVVPPEVERLLRRWLPIARARSEAEGWSSACDPDPEHDPDARDWPV